MRSSGLLIAGPIVACLLSGAVSAQVTQRVSVSSGGVQGNSDSAIPVISADGRYVAFASWATNLAPGNFNGELEAFVRDRQLGMTELVSMSTGGIAANDQCFDQSISADGRYVAFSSYGSNLVPGDTGGHGDVFVRDRRSGTTERVSVDSGGVQGNQSSWSPSISADGRFVAFMSAASNFAAGDQWNGLPDAFVHDRQTGVTECVSVVSHGGQLRDDRWYLQASISADGRYVVFTTYQNNLVSGDTDGYPDVFVRDRQTGTLDCVSVGPNGPQFGRTSWSPSISADGRYVAFASLATDFVPEDTNGCEDVFVRDRLAGTTERVSVSSTGRQGNARSSGSSISADGRYVAFYSLASNLVLGDTNPPFYQDAFVHDRQTARTERANVDSEGMQVWIGCASYNPSISADGRLVAFDSLSHNLVPGDTNGVIDVFVRDRLGGTSFTVVCEPGSGGVIACPCANPPSGPGRGCDNSYGTGGAILAASGGTFLSSDSLEFTTRGELPTALSILTQWTGTNATGVVFGMGVRCTAGTFKRLYTKFALGGSIRAPEFSAGDQQVSVRSAAFGDMIQPGQSRWYLVYYRDPIVLGGCSASSTFNATQTGQVTWWP